MPRHEYYGISAEDVAAKFAPGATVAQKKHCLKAVGEIGEAGAHFLGYASLIAKQVDDPDPEVSAAACHALGCMGQEASGHIGDLAAAARSAHAPVRRAAAHALGELAAHSQVAAVAKLLEDPDEGVRASACLALGFICTDAHVEAMAAKLSDSSPEVVAAACRALGECGLTSAEAQTGAVAAKLRDGDRGVRGAACGALGKMGDPGTREANRVAELLKDPQCSVREAAVGFFTHFAAGEDARTQAAATIAGNLSHAEVSVRAASAAALGALAAAAKPHAGAISKLLDEDAADEGAMSLSMSGVEPRPRAEFWRQVAAGALALAKIGATEHAPRIAEAMKSSDSPDTKVACAFALGKMGPQGAAHIHPILDLLTSSSPYVCSGGCQAIEELARRTPVGQEAGGSMAEALVHPAGSVRAAAARALGAMSADEGHNYTEDLAKLFGDIVCDVRIAAMEALASLGEHGQMYAGECCRMIYDGNIPVRVAALRALRRMGARGAAFAEEVVELLGDPATEVVVASLEALGHMGEDAAPFAGRIADKGSDKELRQVRDAATAAARKLGM